MGYIFHSSVNSQGEQQVLYKFSYQAKSIIISTGVHVKKKQFSKLKGDSKSRLAKIESIVLDSIQEAKNKVPPYTSAGLKKIIDLRVEGRNVENGEIRLKIRAAWESRIEFFQRAKKYDSQNHNIESLRVVMTALSNMYVDEITSDHIKKLRDELLIERSPSSVAGYLRDLRATIISIVGKSKSPFIGVPLPKVHKKKNIALNLEELELFKNVKLKTFAQNLARDMFIFRYYCLGMRVKDQLLLRRDQILDGRLSYTTNKTKKHFDFKLPQECLDILAKYPKGKYAFPVLSDLKGEELNAHLREIVRRMNKTLKRIAKHAGIKKSISTHSARHTFAFINRGKGAHFIQKAFDHEDISTTEGYIESLSNQDSIMDELWR